MCVTGEPICDDPSPKLHENENGEPAPPFADAENVKTVVASPLVGETSAVTTISEIVTEVEDEAVPPFPSVAVTVAGYDPGWEYACVAGAPEPDEPSPKVHPYENEPSPPEGDALNVSTVPGAAGSWSTDAVTEGSGLMTTLFDADAMLRSTSVTVQVASYVSGDPKEWVTVGPVAMAPSLRVHA